MLALATVHAEEAEFEKDLRDGDGVVIVNGKQITSSAQLHQDDEDHDDGETE